MGYREQILTLLKRGTMIKLKGQGLAVPHMKLNNVFKTRPTGTISKRSIIDQIDSRLSSLKLGKKKTSVGKGITRKKLLSGGRLKKSSRKSSKKSTGGKIKHKKASKKQSFKALKFNF